MKIVFSIVSLSFLSVRQRKRTSLTRNIQKSRNSGSAASYLEYPGICPPWRSPTKRLLIRCGRLSSDASPAQRIHFLSDRSRHMSQPIPLALRGQWFRSSLGHSLICAGRKLKRRNRLSQHLAKDEPITLFVRAGTQRASCRQTGSWGGS